MAASLPRVSIRNDVIYPADISSAISMMRIHSNIVRVDWEFSPTIGIVARDIDRLGVDIRSFREPLTRAIKKVVIPSIRKNFDEGGRPAWEPLAEATIKMRGYEAWPILNRSGALKKAATSFSIWDVSLTSAAVRSLPSKVWYGQVHQAGYGSYGKHVTAAKSKLGPKASPAQVAALATKLYKASGGGKDTEIPQRQFIMLQPDDEYEIELVFAEWLEERVARVGRFG